MEFLKIILNKFFCDIFMIEMKKLRNFMMESCYYGQLIDQLKFYSNPTGIKRRKWNTF